MNDEAPKRTRKRRAKPCPCCGSTNTLPIVYGRIGGPGMSARLDDVPGPRAG